MADFGDKFPYSNVEKRNCLVYAILQGKRQIV